MRERLTEGLWNLRVMNTDSEEGGGINSCYVSTIIQCTADLYLTSVVLIRVWGSGWRSQRWQLRRPILTLEKVQTAGSAHNSEPVTGQNKSIDKECKNKSSQKEKNSKSSIASHIIIIQTLWNNWAQLYKLRRVLKTNLTDLTIH